MRAALEEASRAAKAREIPVGAVVVWGNRIIGRGYNLTEHFNDATAHAEMQAITAASNTITGKYLRECRLYVTLEPCPMCAGACFWSQLHTLVYAASDDKRGYTTISPNLLHPRTRVISGVLQEPASQLLKDFFARLRR